MPPPTPAELAAIEAEARALAKTNQSRFNKFVIAAFVAILGLSVAIFAGVSDTTPPPTTVPPVTTPPTTATTAAPTTTVPPTTSVPPTTTVPPTTSPPSLPRQGSRLLANTGPSGTLAPSGSIATTANGQTIQNLDISGSIQVRHDNVTIRNVRIRSAGQAISINGNTGLVVEDCELDGLDATSDAAIAEHNYTMRRCELLRHGEGPRINGNVTLEGNYMHSFSNWIAQGAHQDGVQTTSGSNIVIRHNTILIDVDGRTPPCSSGRSAGRTSWWNGTCSPARPSPSASSRTTRASR